MQMVSLGRPQSDDILFIFLVFLVEERKKKNQMEWEKEKEVW